MKNKARYGHLIKWLFSIVDLFILNSAYFSTALLIGDGMSHNIRLTGLILNLAYFIVLYFRLDLHDRRVMYADNVAINAVKSVALHAGIFLSIVEFLGIVIPLKGIIVFYLVFTVVLLMWWLISRKILKRYRNRGFNYKNIIVVGDGAGINRFIEEVTGDMGYGYNVNCLFGCAENVHPEIEHRDIGEIKSYIETYSIDELYCTIPDNEGSSISELMKMSEDNAVEFYYIPQIGPTVTRKFTLLTFGNVPVMSVRPNPSQNPFNRLFKRLIDIVVSLLVLIILPLILIPAAIAIKMTSKGPVFFIQKRTGYRGKVFNCYKLRTMHIDNHQVTKVGKFLRHYSIDELPQFLNVLKGEMSIVGPRPHMVEHTELYKNLIEKYMLRHIVKPGITGWAQVLGYRGRTDELWMMEKRVECDVWYAENWNFMLDLKIVVLTIIKSIKGDKNAY